VASKISENARKKGGNPHFRFYDVTSGDVNRPSNTFGHVTSSSHVGHAQWYILYYYYSKEIKRGKNLGMRRTYFRDVTSGHTCVMV
jgi:hypothetical protein